MLTTLLIASVTVFMLCVLTAIAEDFLRKKPGAASANSRRKRRAAK